MRKAVTGFWWSPASEGVSALVVTAAFFAFGGVLGAMLSARIAESSGELLLPYLEQFLHMAHKDGLLGPDQLQFLWLSLRWPLAAFALGFSSLGLLGIPALSGVRGFLFSFSVGIFARTLGRRGLGAAFLLLGASGLIAIPVFLVISAQSFMAAKALAARSQGKRELPYSRAYILRCGVLMVFLCFGLFLEWYLVPALLSGWADILVS